MDIQKWFNDSGSYAEGVKLYSKLPVHSSQLLKNFSRESTSNFLKLKYELKKAILSNASVITEKPAKQVVPPVAKKEVQDESLLQVIIQQSAAQSFDKESMAKYPRELHATYRERVNLFYQACELKFQLNALPDADEKNALNLILQLEDLWTKIDRAWVILDHWKDHNRIMPSEESKDYSKLNGIQLVTLRARLETSISKRTKTIEKMRENCILSPEDRTLANSLNRKLEQLQQLIIDLETIRNLLKNESNTISSSGVAHRTKKS